MRRAGAAGFLASRRPRLCFVALAVGSCASSSNLAHGRREVVTNEQERAVVRTDLNEISERMTELRDLANWWNGLSAERQEEFRRFQDSVMVYRDLAR